MDDLCLSVRIVRQDFDEKQSDIEFLETSEHCVFNQLTEILEEELQPLSTDRSGAALRSGSNAIGAAPLARQGHFVYGIMDLLQQHAAPALGGKLDKKIVELSLTLFEIARYSFLRCKAFEVLAKFSTKHGVGQMPIEMANQKISQRVYSDTQREKIQQQWIVVLTRTIEVAQFLTILEADISKTYNRPGLPSTDFETLPSKRDQESRDANYTNPSISRQQDDENRKSTKWVPLEKQPGQPSQQEKPSSKNSVRLFSKSWLDPDSSPATKDERRSDNQFIIPQSSRAYNEVVSVADVVNKIHPFVSANASDTFALTIRAIEDVNLKKIDPLLIKSMTGGKVQLGDFKVVASTTSWFGEKFAFIASGYFEVWKVVDHKSLPELMCWGTGKGFFSTFLKWDLEANHRLTGARRTYGSAVMSNHHLFLAPGNSSVVSNWLDVHSTQNGRRLWTLDITEGALAFCVNQNGSLLGVGTKVGTVKLFGTSLANAIFDHAAFTIETNVPQQLAKIPISPERSIVQIVFSPNSCYLSTFDGSVIKTFSLTTDSTPTLISRYPTHERIGSLFGYDKVASLTLYVKSFVRS